jgi:hypothetical protein
VTPTIPQSYRLLGKPPNYAEDSPGLWVEADRAGAGPSRALSCQLCVEVCVGTVDQIVARFREDLLTAARLSREGTMVAYGAEAFADQQQRLAMITRPELAVANKLPVSSFGTAIRNNGRKLGGYCVIHPGAESPSQYEIWCHKGDVYRLSENHRPVFLDPDNVRGLCIDKAALADLEISDPEMRKTLEECTAASED